MKFDVEKFIKDTNGSNRYSNWNDNLLKMGEALGMLPTYENGTYYWWFEVGKRQSVQIGFSDDGTLWAKLVGWPHKEPNKAVLNKEETNNMLACVLNTINIFDEFGFIIRSSELN